MSLIKKNIVHELKLSKHYIKDLSFENFQSISQQNLQIDDLEIFTDISAIYHNYNEDKFGVISKYRYDCSLIHSKDKIFILELDYFGLFEIKNKNKIERKNLTQSGVKLLFPYSKKIIENTIENGSTIKIILNEVDFSLVENI